MTTPEEFDFGADPVEHQRAYKLWPQDGEQTALLDGDLLPYIVGFTTEEEDYVSASAEVKRLICQGDTRSTLELYETTKGFQNASDKLDSMLNMWIEWAGCDSAIVYLTDSSENFRNSIAFTREYKGNRNEDKPFFFHELRLHMLTHHSAVMSCGCEADDLMSIEMYKRLTRGGLDPDSNEAKILCDACIVSKDKDLMIPSGWHFNPDVGKRQWVSGIGWLDPRWKTKEVKNYEYWPLVQGKPTSPQVVQYLGVSPDTFTAGKRKGEVKTKRVEAGTVETQYIDSLKGAGLKFFYAQILMGDRVDNYPGLKGCGPSRAFELLDGVDTEEGLWEAVVSEYERSLTGGTDEPIFWELWYGGRELKTAREIATEQGQLAWMQRKEGEVWLPPSLPST